MDEDKEYEEFLLERSKLNGNANDDLNLEELSEEEEG